MRSRIPACLALLVAAAIAPTASAQAAPLACNGDFEAHVRSGPDADLSLVGDLRLSIADTGRLRGTLVQGRGTERLQIARVSGVLSGSTITLTFRTRTGRRLTGTGTAPGLRSCAGDLDGTLRGPARGDRGVWGYAIGG